MSAQNDPFTGRRIVDARMYSVEFKPKAGGRRVLALIVLTCLVATAYSGWLGYEDRDPINYGITAALTLLTVILWAAWATATVAHLHVHGGVLEIRRAGQTERFDLTSHYTRLRVEGTPRSSRWRVLIDRPAGTPYVINRTMVDPKAFTRVLEAYHHVGQTS